jgi:hypothetical protein
MSLDVGDGVAGVERLLRGVAGGGGGGGGGRGGMGGTWVGRFMFWYAVPLADIELLASTCCSG